MMKIPQYSVFVKKVLDCKNLLELREIVGKINEFNKINSIRSTSDDFKKLETIVGLMKIKLRSKQGVDESRNFMISETQLKTIVESNKTDRLISEYLNLFWLVRQLLSTFFLAVRKFRFIFTINIFINIISIYIFF